MVGKDMGPPIDHMSSTLVEHKTQDYLHSRRLTNKAGAEGFDHGCLN
jgi:hypothetical protein